MWPRAPSMEGVDRPNRVLIRAIGGTPRAHREARPRVGVGYLDRKADLSNSLILARLIQKAPQSANTLRAPKAIVDP
jgi:hypothetical protein